MFSDATCLILGAGASRPYGFPTSGELRKLLLGKPESVEVFTALGFASADEAANQLEELMVEGALNLESKLARFRTFFAESQRVSIDAFLSGLPETPQNNGFRQIARHAIASVLLMCEKETQLNGNWYQWLLEFLLRRGKDFPSGLLKIVTFNYDRSIEQYLWKAFMRSFDLSPTGAKTLLERIEIVHVYGHLGPLLFNSERDPIPFGDVDRNFQAIRHLAVASPRIDTTMKDRVRATISYSQRLIFLGFGFWRENIDLLFNERGDRIKDSQLIPNLPDESWFRKQIFASRFKLWGSVVREVDAKVGFVNPGDGPLRPLINWGDEDEDLWEFVTRRDLAARS